MRRLSITYAMYYNHHHNHSGAIYQGRYKNILLENEYSWLYLTKYIHRNPVHLKQGYEPCKLASYPYSSYPNYLGSRSDRWLNTAEILGRHSKDPVAEYKRFVENGTDVGKIERLTLDVEELQY